MAQEMASIDDVYQQAHDFITRCKTEFQWEDLSNDFVMDIRCGVQFHCTRAIIDQFPEVGYVTPIDKNPHTLLLEDTVGTEFSTRLRDARLQFHNCDILDRFDI
ncbi:hypothetical protein NPIL_588571 [Nephila pilipes]|uniref:Uncharacterized protein n=1 Tax=Nephila pilipes TaxID=299642 RepID=A0A8X6NUH5_NEPPI|nr:hypothetical protein NPIL_588571 [Nephila pilipes]